MTAPKDRYGVGSAFLWTAGAICAAAAAACLVLGLSTCTSANAAGLTHLDEVWFFSVAYGQYGSAHGGIPKPPQPKISFDSTANICAAMGRQPDCPASGYFDNGEIVMSEDLDFSKKFDGSKLVHELIHYLQYVHEGPTQNCRQWYEREWEAFAIQHFLLEKDGEERGAAIVRASVQAQRCPIQEPVQQ